MAYKITDKCTVCGKCKESCPVEAISAGEKKYAIDPEKCVDCGVCAGECPSEAIEAG
jgi:ferredoxin